MKNTIKFFALFICVYAFIACEEEKRSGKGGIAPEPVTGVSAEPGTGEVVLKWKNPADPNLDYVKIVYTGSKGMTVSKNISVYAADSITLSVTDTIDGFTDTGEHVFELISCNVGGAQSAPERVKASPLDPVYVSIFPTIIMEADFGGATVSWENTSGKKAFVVVEYPDPNNPSAKISRTFNAATSGKGSVVVAGTDGEIEFAVYATDVYRNESGRRQVKITPYAETEFDKTKWSVPGYNSGSQDATIGYSSQATNEGAAPNGRVAAIFDGNISTFWHARWGSPATSFPHWYIIDLGAEVTVSRVEMTKRQGNSAGQKGQRFYTCTENGRNADENTVDGITGWTWEDQGEFSFDQANSGPQSCRLVNNPKARYIKVYFDIGHKGSGNYAMVGEMSVYGQE